MKKWLSIILAFALLFTSIPLISAEDRLSIDIPNKENHPSVTTSVYDSVYGPHATFTDLNPNELITITSLTETFGVTRDWVTEELFKGYELHQIYQGLKAKQQGRDYEQFMTSTYPKPAPDPIIEHQEQMKSVSEAVYQASVTEQVYGKESPSVTDQVYGLREKRSLAFLSNNLYDEKALRNRPIRLDQAPYSVGSVSDHISPVDGSLRVEVTDMVMPGSNGMNFALRRIYDSSLAKDDIYVNENGRNSTQATQEEEIFHLGKGWIWDISFIKRVNNYRYIYISGVGTYGLEDDRLVGYPLGDLVFMESNKLLQSDERASYELLNKTTGVSQYFNHIGNLIFIEDTDGNYIQFSYKYQPDIGWVLHQIKSSTRDYQGKNEMNISYNGNHTVTIQSGDRRVIYKKERVKKIKNDYLYREQDILTEVIDPMGRSTKYDYGVWKPLFFNLVSSYSEIPEGSEAYRVNWGENEVIALGVIEHPTKAITEYGFDGAIKRKIGDFAEERVVRYKSRRSYYSSSQYTQKNEMTLKYTMDHSNVKDRAGIGDGGKYIEQDFRFSVDVYDKYKTTTYTYEKQFVAYDKPSAIYNTKTEVKDLQTNDRQVFNYAYDRFRRNPNPTRIEETHYQEGYASAPRITTREYDYWGQLTSETNPIGITSRYEYRDVVENKLFRMKSSSVPMDQGMTLSSEYEYDRYRGGLKQAVSKNDRGEIVQQLNYEYDYAGNPIKIRIKGDVGETTIYQDFSPKFKSMYLSEQAVEVKNVEGKNELVKSQMEYIPESGLPTKYTDGNGNQTSYTYDKLGRITAEIHPDGTKTTVVYDDQNNKMFITNPNGLQIEKHFDPLGNLIAETNGRGMAQHTYDENGRLIRKGDFNGSVIQYEYDAWDRIIKEKFGSRSNRVVYNDAANTKTTFDGENNGMRETYDIMGRVIKKEEIKSSGQEVLLARYEYDYAGNVKVAYDGNHNVTKYEYDVLGRLIAVTDAEGKTTRYRYNLSGDMVEVKYADGNTVQKRYDGIGRLLEQTDPNKQGKRFYYDGNGSVIKSIDRKGQIQQFEYNSRGFLTAVVAPDERVSYSYDATGKRTTMTDQTGTTSYAYYPSGELESITYPDKTVLSFNYEKRGLREEQAIASGAYRLASQTERLFSISVPRSMRVMDGTGGELARFEYSYDDSYRIADLKSSSGLNEVYSYDGMNRTGIQQKQGDALFGNYSYTYDNNRNIIAKNDNGAFFQFSYDPLNRIKTSSQFNEAYSYDQRDNRSTLQSDQVPNIKGASYTYDSRNRLTQVTTEDGKAVSYRYNGDNLMVERAEGGVTTRYYYDDRAKIVAEGKVEGNGSITITASYVHDDYGKLLARQVPGQGMQYYVSNGHGDITEIRDAQGNVLNRYTYDIWGNPLVQEEQVPNIFRYSGEYWDAATNLQYLRARWYDPSVGRFINEDTYEGDIKSPLSLNLYTYVENNPLRWLDPSGHIKDSFGATLSMPKDADEAAKLISQAKNNWAYAQQQISAIKSGKGTGMLCKGCNSVDTWKSYQNSMHSWAERIRKTQFVGISAYIKAEAGASLAIGGKLGAEIKDDKIKLYYISTYGQGGANISLTGGFSQTNDSTGKMNSWTGNAGASYGAFFLGEASLKSDMKYLEFSVGGGIGAAAEIYLLPISGEKEYSATWDLPFNLGKKGAILPSYVGAPSAQEWLDMIGGKGW
ncbi:wall-associated protein WapA [Paenibacillus sp. MER 180]|uniref:RHS repeat domain-containing protein n=1 Tax=Paenibacillus sp. MER 180 TaxID=2939570 RepID=UPI00203B1A7A|nr:RHS repeat-associated core domain-containing protein [Paenibacillus sp. MER 180]MCM3292507.1 wall-associated protein WapA [Paenibacillus sp. MER 180]